MDNLLTYLATIKPGEITDTTDLERVLAASWDEFVGDDGGMKGHKLLGRMEDVAWEPLILSFVIERHGGTVLGSTRAELQHWEVNLDQKTALIVKRGRRQLEPMADRSSWSESWRRSAEEPKTNSCRSVMRARFR